MLHAKKIPLFLVLIMLVSAIANSQGEYLLLQKLIGTIDAIDANSITCTPSQVFCIDPKPNIRSSQDRLYVSTATHKDIIGISLYAEISKSRFINYGTYYGIFPQVKRIENADIAASGVSWFSDQQGLFMAAQQRSSGNQDTMFKVVRPLPDGQLQWGNPSQYPLPIITSHGANIEVQYHAKIIGKISQDDTYWLGASTWKGNLEDGGFCYAIGKGDMDIRTENEVPNDFDITVFIVKKNNTGWVTDNGRRIRLSDLEGKMGGFGLKPLWIRLMAEPTVLMKTNVVYLGVRYAYGTKSETETITVQEIIRLVPNKEAEFADVQIEYRNTLNPVLNADFSRDETGKFTMQPTKALRRPEIKIDVAEDDVLCTMNGGRLWLIDMR